MALKSKSKEIIFIFLFLVTVSSSIFAKEITIVDKLGRKITINAPVKRAVVIMAPELILALGLWNQVVGVSYWVYREYKFFNYIKPDWKKKVFPVGSGMGKDINMETLLKLNPDVIITGPFYPEVVKFMEKHGLKVITINPETISEFYKVIKLFGLIFGKENKANFLINEMNKTLNLIQKRLAQLSKPKKVVWIYRLAPLGIACKGAIIDDIFKRLKTINIGDLIKPNCNVIANISIEDLIKYNPDVIFIWGFTRAKPEDIIHNPQWQPIKAVKENEVYKAPRNLGTWSPSLVILSLWTAVRVYPEYFKDINFIKYSNSFYLKIFGVPYTKVVVNE
ncbi:ABC transporter substrate-binding protein [Thermodesulfobacterium hydrogeniphilum]|uniref:ABC transporter substrate-binding protein n=1 Tax=Thermodesulfobacterium hydrogeniphilum TaxID=161156 RepID=UPI00068BC4C2|nr:ABC transporter substrate-binding protein [Thermodesulfobacterium hydrogeniphilum]